MMRSTPLKMFAVAAALTFGAAAFGNPRDDSKRQAVAEVEGYKDWPRVTVKPIAVSVASAMG